MAASAASLLTALHSLKHSDELQTCPVESISLSVHEDTTWAQEDMLSVTAGSNEATNSSTLTGGLAEDGEAEVEAAAVTISEEASSGPAPRPCEGHEEEQEGKTKGGIGSLVPREAQQTLDDCCAASMACSEVLPVVFACSVEDVKAVDEPVQRSLRIYRHEASIVLRQPRVLSCRHADEQRDVENQVRQELQGLAETRPCDDPATPGDIMEPLEAVSDSEAEDQPAGDTMDTRGISKEEAEHEGPSDDPTLYTDASLAPVFLLLVTTAAAMTIMAAVAHPFGANLSSGIIAIAVFLSLSKWHTSLVTPGGSALTLDPPRTSS